MLVRAAVLLVLLVGCRSQDVTPTVDANTPLDAGADVNACTTCGMDTLDSLCGVDGGFDCPPDLGSAGFDAWLTNHAKPKQAHYLGCVALEGCPETMTMGFNVGVGCMELFVFDVNTNKLVGGVLECGSLTCPPSDPSTVLATRGCLPRRCIPDLDPNAIKAAGKPAKCPSIPDAGIKDAAGE
jgi:hypothetical protein